LSLPATERASIGAYPLLLAGWARGKQRAHDADRTLGLWLLASGQGCVALAG
jgi:hypothetical protein